ncbi:hypothetical protein [Aeromonas dhakensis]|uniref:hypothetical protein n=1 Tax=Aeromonas dhakensis TaxID=196024 RepID=UPI000370B0BE|nr:hypothetical protein [Aeromonas dhakensis]
MSQSLTVQARQRLEQYSNALAKSYGIPVNALAKQYQKSQGRGSQDQLDYHDTGQAIPGGQRQAT